MIEYLLIILGIILLIKGADWLIDGGTILGKKLGMSPFLIGMTIIALGTSLPELVITFLALTKNSGEIILGNIIGSNISNLLLILGIIAIISPIKIPSSVRNIDLPFSILQTFILLLISTLFLLINRISGIIFLSFFVVFLYYKIKYSKETKFPLEKISNQKQKFKITLLIIFGSISLFLGGKFIVDGTLIISKNLQISEFLISATMIALGTSLPELFTSLRALTKKKKNLAIGNIIGSNILNITLVLGFASLFKPIIIPLIARLDLIFLLAVSIFVFLLMFIKKENILSKGKGKILLTLYVIYITTIILRG